MKIFNGISKDVVWAIVAIGMFNFFWGPADAYFALYLKSFGASYTEIGIYNSIGKLIPLLFSIPVGILSDKICPKKLAIGAFVGYLLIPILYFMAGFEKSILLLVCAILLNSFFKMIREISFGTLLKELVNKQNSVKVMNLRGIIGDGVWGMGLLAGAGLVYIMDFNQLFLLSIIGVLSTIFILIKFVKNPEKPYQLEKHHPKHHKKSLFKRFIGGVKHLKTVDARVFSMLGLSFFTAFTIGSVGVFTALFIDTLDYGIFIIGLVLGLLNFGLFLAIPLNKLARKCGKFGRITMGFFIMTLAVFSIFIFSEKSIYILFFLFMIHKLVFSSFVGGTRNGIITAFTPQNMQGEITGIQTAIFAFGGMAGSIVFGFLSDKFSLSIVFLVISVIYLFLFIGNFLLFWKYEHTVKHLKDSDLPEHSQEEEENSEISMMHILKIGHGLDEKNKIKK